MCVSSKVLSTKNLKQAANLANGSVEFVKDIIYAENETPTNKLSMYIIVNFGDMYTSGPFLKMIQKNMGGYQSKLLPLNSSHMIQMIT